MLRQLKGGRKQGYAEFLKSSESPKIDGNLNEAYWKNLKEFNVNLDKDSGDKIGPGCSLKIAYDNDNIYIGIFSKEPLMQQLKDTCITHDGAVWKENDVELFFDVNNTGENYMQICVNTLGTIADNKIFKGKHDSTWSSGAKTAVIKGNKSWSMEICIPIKNLTKTPITPGDIWGLNLYRVRKTVTPTQYTCWNPTFGGFHKPARFGKLIFK